MDAYYYTGSMLSPRANTSRSRDSEGLRIGHMEKAAKLIMDNKLSFINATTSPPKITNLGEAAKK